jgi:hypothetical protein
MWSGKIKHKIHATVSGNYSLHYLHAPLHLTDYLIIAKPYNEDP